VPRILGRLAILTGLSTGSLAAAWLGGLVWFAGTSPHTVLDDATATDAIVVLTGGSQRLQSGLELLDAGKGRKLFVSGVNQQVDRDELLRVFGLAANQAECCVVLGHEADNTAGNARESARWMRQEGFHSLRLVTSWYHMRRSLLEFRRAMPGVEIIAHPVFPAGVRAQRWWASRHAVLLVISEYDKYLAALLLPSIERLQAPDPAPVTETRTTSQR